jgi:two-component system cell cycle sensor histidine kinase/response regulator CckA
MIAEAVKLPVLVVDDDSALIRTLADILRLHGYAPHTAGTGREGLAQAKREPPALAIVDLRLPDMDGMELAAKLHELSALTEVVVLTGNASVESAVAALRENSVDYLLKPVNVERLLHVASIATERWQRRQAEDKLRTSDERFRRVFQSDMLGMTFWNGDGTIEDANDAFLRIVGYTREDLEAGRLTKSLLTPPVYAELDRLKWAEVLERGIITPYEKEYLRRDGRRVPVLIGASMVDAERDARVSFVLDITTQKLAERALIARATQQAAVAQFGERALVTDDLARLFNDAVALVAETLDLPFGGVLERRSDGQTLVLRAAVGWSSTQVGQMTTAISDDTQAGYTLSHNEPTIVADMTREMRFAGAKRLREHDIASGITVVIPGPMHAYGVLAAHDKRPREFSRDDVYFLQAIAHVLGTAVERSRADKAFRQAQRLEAVGRLASGVAHDFNNMLTAITGYGEIVKSSFSAGDERIAEVDEILKAAGRAAGLTRQLLAFSRQQVLQPRMVMLNDVVKGIEKMLSRLIAEDIELAASLQGDLGYVKADPGQIEQVILNLCVNARDAMPDGGTLTIETCNVDLDIGQTKELSMEAPGAYVMLAVTDTGIGMDAETRSKIFEPFFTTKPADQGTGLGLATVYGIVKQSGGEIWVYSELGRGTTFKVFLPRLDELAGVEPVEPPRPAASGGTETILLAEDEDAIRNVARRILERAGYTVLMAKNGAEAGAVSEKYEGAIHLLVTDMVMPVMNGTQLAERLRAQRPDVRVLYLSGYTDSTVARQGLLDNTAHFLQKPFSAESLARKIRDVLDARR